MATNKKFDSTYDVSRRNWTVPSRSTFWDFLESFSIADLFSGWVPQLPAYQIKALVLLRILVPKLAWFDNPMQFATFGYALPTGQVSKTEKNFYVRFVRKRSQKIGLDA